MSLSLYLLWSYMLIGAYIAGREWVRDWTPVERVMRSIAWMWIGPALYLLATLLVICALPWRVFKKAKK